MLGQAALQPGLCRGSAVVAEMFDSGRSCALAQRPNRAGSQRGSDVDWPKSCMTRFRPGAQAVNRLGNATLLTMVVLLLLGVPHGSFADQPPMELAPADKAFLAELVALDSESHLAELSGEPTRSQALDAELDARLDTEIAKPQHLPVRRQVLLMRASRLAEEGEICDQPPTQDNLWTQAPADAQPLAVKKPESARHLDAAELAALPHACRLLRRAIALAELGVVERGVGIDPATEALLAAALKWRGQLLRGRASLPAGDPGRLDPQLRLIERWDSTDLPVAAAMQKSTRPLDTDIVAWLNVTNQWLMFRPRDADVALPAAHLLFRAGRAVPEAERLLLALANAELADGRQGPGVKDWLAWLQASAQARVEQERTRAAATAAACKKDPLACAGLTFQGLANGDVLVANYWSMGCFHQISVTLRYSRENGGRISVDGCGNLAFPYEFAPSLDEDLHAWTRPSWVHSTTNEGISLSRTRGAAILATRDFWNGLSSGRCSIRNVSAIVCSGAGVDRDALLRKACAAGPPEAQTEDEP